MNDDIPITNDATSTDDLFGGESYAPEPAVIDLGAKTEVALVEGSKSKGKAKGKIDVIPGDQLSSSVHAIENLKADTARAKAKELMAGSEFDLFKLGGVLAQVHTKEWWSEYGFSDFRSYIEQEHGLNYRKAMYLISIYFGIIEYELTWAEVEGVGWTKLKVLLNPNATGTVVNAANIKMWLDKAKSMTTLQLESAINGALKGPDENATEQNAGKTVTTMTFKLHEDQKETVRAALEKAKEQGNTTVDTVSLEYICLEYLNKPVPMIHEADSGLSPATSLAAVMKDAGWEEVLNHFGKIWPNIEVAVEIPEVAAAA